MAHLSGPDFAVKAGIRFGVFAALTLGFPFIVHGLLLVANTRSVAGASGALAVLAGLFLKPVIVLGFLLALIGPCWWRMRSLGMPGYVGLLPPLLMLMDAPFLVLAGAHWGMGFSLGIMRVSAPILALTGFAMLVAMSVAREPSVPDSEDNGTARSGAIGAVAIVLVVALIVIALFSVTREGWMTYLMWVSPAATNIHARLKPLLRIEYYLFIAKPYVCIAFNAAMVWLVWQSRRGGADGVPPSQPVRSPSPPLSPNRTVFGLRK